MSPPKVALEKAEHKKFNVQEFWDRHFGEEDDESSDDESSDGERSDSGRSRHEPETDRDGETARSDDEGSDDEGSDDEGSDGESSDDERSSSGRSRHEPGTNPDDDAASEDSRAPDEAPPLELNYDALKHIAEHFLPGSHGACTDIATGSAMFMMRSAFYTLKTAGVALAISRAIPRTRFWNKSKARWRLWNMCVPTLPFRYLKFTSSIMMRTTSLVRLSC